jgi:hypothetical protein
MRSQTNLFLSIYIVPVFSYLFVVMLKVKTTEYVLNMGFKIFF